MAHTPENTPTPENKDSRVATESLLSEILGSGEESPKTPEVDLLSDTFISEDVAEMKDAQITTSQESPATPQAVKKPKKPMSTSDFLRIVGAIMLVALIFFGAFLAYIVFNPGQATFFISFGINPGDIARLLKQLVSWIFWFVTFFLSVVWIVYLFRAILTKKEYKKKKTIASILAVLFGILLFSEITVWAFLVQKINATDYENPNGGVIVYDNEKLISERFKNNAQLQSYDNLIGPLELKFDLKSDANFVSKVMDIERYRIDFDGAKCKGNSSLIEGIPSDQAIICTFDQTKVFRPTGIYEGVDRVTHEPRTIAIQFQAIQIAWVVEIKKPKTHKDTAMTYDALSLANLGNIRWYTEKNSDTPISTNPVFSITMGNEPQMLCLSISESFACDKLFIVPKQLDSTVTAKIVAEQNKENPLLYSFRLEDTQVKTGEITDYKWIVNNTVISTDETCTYVSPEYGDVRVSVLLTDSAGNTTELRETLSILHPLQFVKGTQAESLLKVTDPLGKSLLEDTYSKALQAYYITDVSLPMNVEFDATDVRVENYGYELTGVEWDFDNNGTFEKNEKKVRYEIIEEKRYTVQVRYTFTEKEKNITSTLTEKIILEPQKKDIALVLKLTQDSEYAPATIHVDGSASIPKEGKIIKFMYDFGEGKWPIEGDAIQDYRYGSPGEYTITFIVVRDDGTRMQSSRKIVLKDIPKRILINTSVSSGIVGKPIDFDTNGTIGQIEEYQWDFWDGTLSTEANPTHTYVQKGTYTIKITVTYADRTVRSTDRQITITE